jgi:large subunit ribosomal protein L29
MKARDLRDRSTEDLTELERSLALERFQSKFKNFTNRLDDTSLIRKNKRDLARVKLILTERARGITVVAKSNGDAAKKPKTRAPKPPPAEAVEPAEATTAEAKPPAKKSKAASAKAPAKKPTPKPKAKTTKKGETK